MATNKHYFLLSALIWGLLVICSCGWNIYRVDANTLQLAHNTGRSFFQEIQITRLWNARHGGVYVPISNETQPNPYLDVPDRDVITTGGTTLTKINPAFMTRQISEIAQQQAGIQYHLTSLTPIRPGNKADAWETESLSVFERGQKEKFEFIKSSQTYRYMAPLYVEEACLPCHAKQGYQLGDIRGGISVTIPGNSYVTAANTTKQSLVLMHVILGSLGIIGLYVFRKFRDRHILLLDRKNQALAHEIDERKTIEQALREAKLVAESANIAKSEFLANVSHEIRTPIHAILSFTDFLMKQINHSQQRYLKSIQSSAKALLKLFDDLLVLSKMEADALQIRQEPVYVEQLLQEITHLFLPEIENKALHFSIHIADSLPSSVLLDRIRLKQILINLVGNALKFTSKGEVKIIVSGERESQAPDHVTLVIEVVDTGIGIRQEDQNVIFDLFRQKDGGKRRKYAGVGIGLTMTKRLVDMMQGKIILESQPHAGSRFQITLPHVKIIEETPLKTSPSELSIYPKHSQKPKTEHYFPISNDIQKRLPELIKHLETDFLQQCRELQGSFVMRDVVMFAQKLRTIASDYQLFILKEYSDTLYTSAQQYDVTTVENLLADFPQLIEQITQMK